MALNATKPALFVLFKGSAFAAFSAQTLAAIRRQRLSIMRILSFLLLSLVFLECGNQGTKTVFLLPKNEDINNIIETIIRVDSLPVTKSDSTKYSYPILTELNKIEINIPAKETEDPPPPVWNCVSIYDLLDSKLVKSKIRERDSAYFQFQNKEMKNFKISGGFIERLILTDFEKQKIKKVSGGIMRYYYLSIPIFSFDNNRAYVEVTRICPMCGRAYAIFLEKIENKWTIIDRFQLWIN